jgi:thiol:disulfide interchange protein
MKLRSNILYYMLIGISMAVEEAGKRYYTPLQVDERAIAADVFIRHTKPTQQALDEFLGTTGTRFVFFSARWCQHCKRATPRWQSLQNSIDKSKTRMKPFDFQMTKIDCTDAADFCEAQGADGYPTMFLYHQGARMEEYFGEHNPTAMGKYLIQKLDLLQRKVVHEEL